MLTSLGLIFLLGLLMAAVCQRIHLPRIIGMLLTGIILGPYVLDLLDVSILNISSELRQIALIIILLKAGLSLDLKDLKKVGRSAVMLACVPATCELLAFVILHSMRTRLAVQQEEEVSVENMLQSTPEAELEDIDVESKSETRKMIEKFVDENPESAAALLRNWLNEDWN